MLKPRKYRNIQKDEVLEVEKGLFREQKVDYMINNLKAEHCFLKAWI